MYLVTVNPSIPMLPLLEIFQINKSGGIALGKQKVQIHQSSAKERKVISQSHSKRGIYPYITSLPVRSQLTLITWYCKTSHTTDHSITYNFLSFIILTAPNSQFPIPSSIYCAISTKFIPLPKIYTIIWSLQFLQISSNYDILLQIKKDKERRQMSTSPYILVILQEVFRTLHISRK